MYFIRLKSFRETCWCSVVSLLCLFSIPSSHPSLFISLERSSFITQSSSLGLWLRFFPSTFAKMEKPIDTRYENAGAEAGVQDMTLDGSRTIDPVVEKRLVRKIDRSLLAMMFVCCKL